MVMVTILESIISETQNLCVSSFLPSFLNLAFKNAGKKKKKNRKSFLFLR